MEIKIIRNIRKTLENIFESLGIYIDCNNEKEILHLDSVQIVSIILEIEDKFLVSVTESNIKFDQLRSFNDYFELIISIFEKNSNELKSGKTL